MHLQGFKGAVLGLFLVVFVGPFVLLGKAWKAIKHLFVRD